jgi:nucleotide-binding universal stress UspA family protein
MKFLVAVDGSAEAEDALAYAIDFAEAVDATVTAVYAVNPTTYDVGGSDPIAGLGDADERLIAESLEDAESRGLEVLNSVEELADELGHAVETELLYGDPVEVVTEFAEDSDVDAIYVGHRGRSERTDMMVGSVAKGLVGRARVPVTVVR